MVEVNDAFEVRYKYSGENFEVLVDFDKLNEFKKNPKSIDVYDVLADTKIFKNEKRGEVASENVLKKVFNGKSDEEILKEILLKGDCQVPIDYMNKLREKKKKQVINYIAENALNPQTKGKYTFLMIESEVNKLKYNFNSTTDFIVQAEDVLKLLKKRIPIRLDKIILEVKIPGQYCGAFYGKFRKFGIVKKEYFDSEGNLRLHFEIMESILDTVADYINKNSNSTAEYYVLKD